MPGPQELVFAPLGGVGEIGMNLSIYGVGGERRQPDGNQDEPRHRAPVLFEIAQ